MAEMVFRMVQISRIVDLTGGQAEWSLQLPDWTDLDRLLRLTKLK